MRKSGALGRTFFATGGDVSSPDLSSSSIDILDKATKRLIQSYNQPDDGPETNLSLLAASGAMLRPTRTGSFSESMGNAAEAAVPVIQSQREWKYTKPILQAKAQEAAGLSYTQAMEMYKRSVIAQSLGGVPFAPKQVSPSALSALPTPPVAP